MEPGAAVEIIEKGGVVALLTLAVLALGWMYIGERNKRTEEIKQFGDKYLEQSRSLDKVVEVLGGHGQKIDGLSQKVDQMNWERRT